MRLRSNDGIRMWIAGKLVLEDPGYHNARWLDPVVLRSKEAGWYALSVDYFQRFRAGRTPGRMGTARRRHGDRAGRGLRPPEMTD